MSEAHNVQELPLTSEQVPPEHKNLAAAVVAVMAEVKRLEKDQENAFANYMFTSIDDYKDELRPVMAKHGIVLCVSQTGFNTFETKSGQKETTNCIYRFKLWLEHVGGDKGDKEGLTVPLPYTGAQTAGIARSYAVKEYLKSRFLQSSGDLAEDADSYAMVAKLTKEQARPIYTSLVEDLRNAGEHGDRKKLSEFVASNKVLLDAMPNDWRIDLQNEYKQAELGIAARERAELSVRLPDDTDAWLENMDAAMGVTKDSETLNDVWIEYQDTAHAMPDDPKKKALNIFKRHQDRVSK